MLPEITAKVGPPRALVVPYPLGFPLGAPNEPSLQRQILRRLLATCHRTNVPFVDAISA